MKGDIHEVHERRCRVVIPKADLYRLVQDAALEFTKFDPALTHASITFEDETEGSPSYKTGTRCVVQLTEKLSNSNP